MELLGLLLIGFVLFLAVGAAYGFSAHGRMQSLEARLAALADEIARLRTQPAAAAIPPAPEPGPAHAHWAWLAQAADLETLARRDTAHDAEPSAPPPAPSAPAPARGGDSIEQQITSRWMVWLGGVTLALGGLFLVGYAAEHGWLGPATRCLLGLAAGALLTGAGEYLRRAGRRLGVPALESSLIPPAATGAGLAIAFASIYAAFGLYDLIGAEVAFVALALLAGAALALSLLHGPMVAHLGLLGGYLTPMLVGSDAPQAVPLFAYLAALAAGLSAVARVTAWRTLLGVHLIGAGLWLLLWLSTAHSAADTLAVGAYAGWVVAALALATLVLPAPAAARRAARDAGLAATAAACGAAVFALWAFGVEGYGAGTLIVLAGLTLLFLWAAQRPRFAPVAAAGAALGAGALLSWPPLGAAVDPNAASLAPPDPRWLYLLVAAALGGAHLLAGLFLYRRAARPEFWAWLAAAAPWTYLAIAYGRVLAFGNDPLWALAALTMGAGFAGTVRTLIGGAPHRGRDAAVAAFSAAAAGFVALGLAMALSEAWLTVALAAQAAALAWSYDRFRFASHERIALALAAIVLVRLVLNPDIFDYALGPAPAFGWILYGYGLPAVLFFGAARMFRGNGRSVAADVLEAGAMLLALLLVFFEIRVVFEGDLDAPRYGFAEMALHTTLWGAAALGLERLDRPGAGPTRCWAWRAIGAAALLQFVFGHVLFGLPLASGAAVGGLPLLNWLVLGYAVPAALFFAFARRAEARGSPETSLAASFAGHACVTLWLTLEVRRIFHGPVLSGGGASEAEWYAYSAVWLGQALVVLGLAIGGGAARLRWASLALLLLVTLKVFVSDMAALEGLWRVASFFGLGLVLLGIGWTYQRFVFPRGGPAGAA